MQFVVCKIPGCGFRSNNGFCLNRMLVINQQGMCKYLTKPGWNQEIKEEWRKSTYHPQEEMEAREPVPQLLETSDKSEQREPPR